MVRIAGGINSGTDPDHGDYMLTVDSFYMDPYEVTNDDMVYVMQWAYDHGKIIIDSSSVKNIEGDQQKLLNIGSFYCCITWDGSELGIKPDKGSGYPCVEITWYGAVAYCNYRSEMDGKVPCYNFLNWDCNFGVDGYRLPTREEWQYAARGGLQGNRFPWGDTINHDNANYLADRNRCSYDTSPYSTFTYHPDYNNGVGPFTSPVGSFAPNGFGLYDMAGNVGEWCHDVNFSYRYICGGGWSSYADYLRCGNGGSYYLATADNGYSGFRTVCRPFISTGTVFSIQ